MKNRSLLVLLVVTGTLFAGIGLAKITGYWRTENSKVPMKISEGEFSGEYSPSDIRGSYSFDDIESTFGIRPEILADAFGLESDTPGILQAKVLEETWEGLEGDVEVGTDSIRLFTALWTGLPHVPEETTVLPVRAVQILREENRIDEETAESLMSEALSPPAGTGTHTTAEVLPDTADHEVPDRMVKGLTTFGELQSWGVTDKTWETAVGQPMGNRAGSLKDWAEAESRSISEIRALAQELVDAAS